LNIIQYFKNNSILFKKGFKRKISPGPAQPADKQNAAASPEKPAQSSCIQQKD